MLVRDLSLNRGSSSSDDYTKSAKMTMRGSRATLDFTGEAQLKMIQDEAAHRRAQEDHRLDPYEPRIAVAEQIAKTNNELMFDC